MEVQFKKTNPQIGDPTYQTSKSAGFDLAADKAYTIPPGTTVLVSTGLVIATPPDHMLMLAARSSLFKKKQLILSNSVGIIDEDYSGERDVILLSLFNMGQFGTNVSAGERVAQGIFVPITRAEFVETDSMGVSRGGFGSTGDK